MRRNLYTFPCIIVVIWIDNPKIIHYPASLINFQEVLSSPGNMEKMICPVFRQLLSLTKFVFQPIKADKMEGKQLNHVSIF